MIRLTQCLVCISLLPLANPQMARAADPNKNNPAAGVDAAPVLRLEADGPLAHVTAVAFGADSRTLYATGWDKVVRVWKAVHGQFKRDADAGYRVPVGPGLYGALNALAVSADGTWLAAAGNGAVRRAAGFRQPGLWLELGEPSETMRLDQGTIYVFNTRDGTSRRLRGHRGAVLALQFVTTADHKLYLFSCAREPATASGKYLGRLLAWDLARPNAPQAEQSDLADPGSRVSLAAWQTGSGPAGLHVAAVLGSGRMYLWDVGGKHLELMPTGARESFLSAAWLGGPQARLLTGSMVGGTGTARLWQASRQPPEAENNPLTWSTQTHGEQTVFSYPLVLAPVASRAGGGSDYLAIVLLSTDGRSKKAVYQLQLVNLANGQTTTEATLWQGGMSIPVLAVSPDSRYLAIAGARDDDEILIASVADLLAHRSAFQRVVSQAAVIHTVSFVRQRNHRGLLLTISRMKAASNAQANSVIFDATARRLLDDNNGWQPADAKLPAGTIQYVAPTRRSGPALTLSGNQPIRVELPAGCTMTRYALLPAANPIKVPLVAVAWLDEFQQPALALYDAGNGQQVRRLTGHTAAIRSLTFADDGTLLASAADDHTACVWNLTDLAAHIGKRGFLLGLAVKENRAAKPMQLVVAAVRGASPAGGQLHVGDVIEGLSENGRVRRFNSASAFYAAISSRTPGQHVALQIQGRKESISLPLGQAVDERKPLFTFFMGGAGPVAGRDWIGWSPLGPYESSGPRADMYIGWLRSSGHAERPLSFVRTGAYSKEYYRKGLLDSLLRTQRIPAPAQAALQPKLTLWLDGLGPGADKDAQGNYAVRQAPVVLKLAVDGCDAEQVGAVRWQLDGSAPAAFRRSADREWTADLAPVLTQKHWRPGVYRATAIVTTREETPQSVVAELTLHYQPPPPHVDERPLPPRVLLTGPAVVYEGEQHGPVMVSGRIPPASDPRADEGLKATALVSVDNKAIEAPSVILDLPHRSLRLPIMVKPGGSYRVRVRLKNQAGASMTSDEVLIRSLRPPRNITFDKPRQPLHKPLVDLVARVRSPLPVLAVEANVNDAGQDNRQPLRGARLLPPKHAGELGWTIQLTNVPLVLGRNQITLRARNADGWSRQAGLLELNYEGPLKPPEVAILQPGESGPVRQRQQKIVFHVRAAANAPLQRVQLIRGKEILYTADLSDARRDTDGRQELTETVTVQLRPGLNPLGVMAVSEGGPAHTAIELSAPPAGVWLEVDALRPATGGILKPQVLPNGLVRFGRVAGGAVRLDGRVVWDDATDEQLRNPNLQLRVNVNGFLQQMIHLAPPVDGRPERAFRAFLVLNQARDNRIRLALPSQLLAIANNRPDIRVAECAHPQTEQWLHVLLIGVGQRDRQALTQRFLKAVGAQKTADGYRTAVFDRLDLLGPLGPDVTEGIVLAGLHALQTTVERRARAGKPNDVVMVYYAGAESITNRGHVLETSEAGGGLRFDELKQLLDDNLGARVLFLDVTRVAGVPATVALDDQLARWKQDPNVSFGALRFAWQDKTRPVPDAARLLHALERYLPQVRKLGEIESRLRQFSAAYRNMRYDPSVPRSLENLVINKKGSE